MTWLTAQLRRVDLTALWITLLPSLFVAGVGIASFGYADHRTELAGRRDHDEAYLRSTAELFEHGVERVASDLGLLAASKPLTDLAARPEALLERRLAEDDLAKFARAKPDFLRVRLLDQQGSLQLTLEREPGGGLHTRCEAPLSEDEQRLLEASADLVPGQLLVAPLALEAPRAEPERPPRPVLHLATPVQDPARRAAGLLLVTHDATSLLDYLDVETNRYGELHLLDGRGDWLHAPDPALEFGALVPGAPSFASEYPSEWAAVQARPAGELSSASGWLAFRSIAPPTPLGGPLLRTHTAPTWKLVALQPAAQAEALAWGRARRGLLQLLVAAGLLAPTCWSFALSRGRRRRAVRALLESERRYEAVTDSVSEALLTVDDGAHVTSWNRAAATIFGLRDHHARGMPLGWLLREEQPGDLDRLLSLPAGERLELIGTRMDGSELPLELSVGRWADEHGTHVSLVGRDISDRREVEQARDQLEGELLHARKLEAVGQLAAGIAHEINTPTQFVGDNTRFLKDAFEDVQALLRQSLALVEELESAGAADQAASLRACLEEADVEFLEEEIPRALEQSLEGLDRVARIVGAMKEFAHPGAVGLLATDLNQCVRSTVTVATNEWKYACELELELQDDLPPVVCNAGEINQVVLNMIVNAAHAVEVQLGPRPDHKGTIRIATRTHGQGVELRIADTGVGIPAEQRPRIFDPFFTTKGVGKGSGQGLAIAYDVIVHKHQGSITVDSTPGAGSTFVVYLPLHPKEGCQDPLTDSVPGLAP